MAVRVVILGVAIACCARVADAEFPGPRLDRVFPLGAAAGATVEVDTPGRDLEDAKSLLFDHPGIKAEWVSGTKFKVTVAADVPEGTYDLRVSGRFGVSNARVFEVSHALKEVVEVEPNHTPADAQALEMNSVVNGVSSGLDQFWITLSAGQRVVVECHAEKLGSEMDSTLKLAAENGRLLLTNRDYYGRDARLDFVAPAAGKYLLTVNDLTYREGLVYRLVVTDRPHVENVFPQAVELGKAVELTALGRNFGSAAHPSGKLVGGLPLDELRFSMTPTADGDAARSFRFVNHPYDLELLPTAATCTLDGEQIRVPLAREALRTPILMYSQGPIQIASLDSTEEKPQPLTIPATVCGRFERPRQGSWFEIDSAESGVYWLQVYSHRIGGLANPYAALYDDKNNRMLEHDDSGQRSAAFTGRNRDPVGTIKLEAKKRYRLIVKDRYERSGPQFHYVLTLRKPGSDFQVAAVHGENPGPAGTTLWRGGAEVLDLVVQGVDGEAPPVTVTAENLPPGVHAVPTAITGDFRGSFVLWADADAAEFTGPIRLVATGRDGEKTLRRVVRPHVRLWTDPKPNQETSQPTRELVIAVREKAPFGLRLSPDKITVEAGQKAALKLIAVRHWPEFTDKIAIKPLWQIDKFKLAATELPAGQNEVGLTIDVQPGTAPGDYTLSVSGEAQIPFNKDPAAKDRPKVTMSDPSQPVTITVVAKAKK